MVNCPDAAPALVGSNCTLRVAVWPGFRVTGKFIPDIENPEPLKVAELTVTEAVPVEVRVTDCVVGVPMTVLPNEMLVALMLSVEVPVVNWITKVSVTPPAVAVRVTLCWVLNDETVALKLALVALAGTVTELGTVIAELLLARFTVSPLLPAAADRLTVQATVPAPDMDPLLHVRALRVPGAEVPDPLMLTTMLPADELL